ncbi:MAG: SDR family oxidoreductase [Pseudomonadota bacterium]
MTHSDKIALVTGAGAGIGQAAALALAEDGFHLALAGRRLDPLEETARRAAQHGVETLIVSADVSEPAAVESLFASVSERFGRLDVLFNNVGAGAPATPFEDTPYDAWQNVLQTTVTSTFLCTQHAIRMMKAQQPSGGRIINNGSLSADTPRRNAAPYTAAKHAVTGLTKSTALDCRDYNIACGQIDIGNVETQMSSRFATGVIQANGEMAIEPRIRVSDVARAVSYMAGLPLDTNVLFLTVMATKMPYVGRG